MEDKIIAKTEEFNKEIDSLKLKIEEYEKFNEKQHHMYKEAVIYDDIFTALESGIIKKQGNPAGWDEKSYRQNLWNSKKMLNIGKGA